MMFLSNMHEGVDQEKMLYMKEVFTSHKSRRKP